MMVKGMPHIDHLDKVCESSVLNKHHRASFAKKVNWKANKPLELIHIVITQFLTIFFIIILFTEKDKN